VTALALGTAISEPSARRQAGLTPIDLAFADYDRTRPIIDGRVRADGLLLNATVRWIGDFCRKPVYEEFDAAEMSFSWYVMARHRGEPVIALPIFLLRMAVLNYIYVRTDSSLTEPADLIGKRIGSRGYRQTVNLWLRGLLNEHYGLSPAKLTWVLAEESEDAGYTIPKDIPVEIRKGSKAVDNLKSGVVDAMICTSVPAEFRRGEKWIRRLFPDARKETQDLVARTGIIPTTHVLVMKEGLAQEKPWIADSLYRTFAEAQNLSIETYLDPKRMSLFDSETLLEQHQASYGTNPYVQGFAPNREVVATFVRYAHEQGYISQCKPIEELFAPSTLSL
jgi:4,5-dihydroxyphthalate decarboxylase